MPADDSFFRNPKRMHGVFAVSMVVLFATTIWMMADDHSAEWHDHQRTMEKIRALNLQRKKAQLETPDVQAKVASLEKQLATLKDELRESEAYREKKKTYDEAERVFDLAERALKDAKAQRDVDRANYNLAIRDALSSGELAARKKQFDDQQAEVDRLQLDLDAKTRTRDTAKAALGTLTARRDAVREELKELNKEINRLHKALTKIQPEGWFSNTKRKVMEWPIIDGFNSHLEIKQDWLPDLKIKLGMATTARFDRCRTCHLGIADVEAGNIAAFPHGVPSDATDVAKWVAEQKYPHPYSTHPNPDLYLTASSPHPVVEFGCTICHDGNGSGTSFQNGEHTPNNPHTGNEWKKEFGWRSNHFWEYPMLPKRFSESGCLKCHHKVEELGQHPKFGSSAPKLFKGYRLIQKMGCFGCHEINGFESGKSIGPDLRLEPPYASVALQFIHEYLHDRKHAAFDASRLASLLGDVARSPDDANDTRHEALTIINADKASRTKAEQELARQTDMAAKDRAAERKKLDARHLSAAAYDLATLLEDVDSAGLYRKVGPSLRHVSYKTSAKFISYWTEEPKRFRPTTRMPQFFKLTNQQDPHAQKLMPVELAAIAAYLEDKSQPIKLLKHEADYEPDADRGQQYFAERGCVACHKHGKIENTFSDFGPDLSRVWAKIRRNKDNPAFSDWLYTWLKDPQRYHKRSRMPNTQLAPEKKKDPELGIETTVDPAADIVAFLLQKNADDKLPDFFSGGNSVDEAALDELALLFMKKAIPERDAEQVLDSKQYPHPPERIKGDEVELTATQGKKDISDDEWRRVKLRYVGRRTISRYGCYACHDIPGFEKARPIGTTLQDWGRKDTSKLALEHIEEWLHHHGEADGSSTLERAETAMKRGRAGDFKNEESAQSELAVGYYYDSLLHHGRPGFLWQKLRQPRSYDYEMVGTKGYDERLRMPRFPLSEDDIDAIATFVLGLVADPPAAKYIYRSAGAALDRIEGERLLDKYNCTSCHRIELPKLAYKPIAGNPDLPELEVLQFHNPNGLKPLGLDLLKELKPPNKTGGDPQPINLRILAGWLGRHAEVENVFRKKQPAERAPLEAMAVAYFDQRIPTLVSRGVSNEEIDAAGQLLWDSTQKRKRNAASIAGENPKDDEKPIRAQLEEFLKKHREALTAVIGIPSRVEFHGLKVFNPDEDPAEAGFRYALWEPLEIDGRLALPGGTPLALKPDNILERTPGRGGPFADWLFDRLKKPLDLKVTNEARQKGPPLLVMEGHKVQTPWLFNFLKNPEQLRFTTVLRMPRFNMSDYEAQKLANYFAVVDGAEYPYQQIPQRQAGYVAEQQEKLDAIVKAASAAQMKNAPFLESIARHPGYDAQAWKMLTNEKLCLACHSIGGTAVQGQNRKDSVRGPDLKRAPDRMRPRWTRLWISNPAWLVPYTSMPSLFAEGKVAFGESFDGVPEAQVRAIRDALMNYHELMERHKKTQFIYPKTAPMPGETPPGSASTAPADKAIETRKTVVADSRRSRSGDRRQP